MWQKVKSQKTQQNEYVISSSEINSFQFTLIITLFIVVSQVVEYFHPFVFTTGFYIAACIVLIVATISALDGSFEMRINGKKLDYYEKVFFIARLRFSCPIADIDMPIPGPEIRESPINPDKLRICSFWNYWYATNASDWIELYYKGKDYTIGDKVTTPIILEKLNEALSEFHSS